VGDDRLEPYDGDGQTATAGTALDVAPSVRVTDADGHPVIGLAVTFSVTAGGGSLAGAVAISGADGVARVGAWTLGERAGGNGLRAVAAGVAGAVDFSATGTPGPADRCTVTAADSTPAAGSEVGVEALLADRYGNPVSSGVSVTFSTTVGASVSGANPATTDADGVARTTLTAGTVAGTSFTVTARGDGTSAVGTSAPLYVVAAAPHRIALEAGDGQSAPAGDAVAVAPSVVVGDRYGNPCADVAVRFAVTAGGGSVSGGGATTDAAGIAAVASWTLGPVAGANELSATADGLSGSPVVFSASGVVGPPAQFVVTASTYHPYGGATVTVRAQLADRVGNSVRTSGVRVYWSLTGAAGSLSASSSLTNADGVATVNLTVGSTVGASCAVTASDSTGRTGTSDPITVASGAPMRIAVAAGDGQTAAVGTAVTTRPRVLVTDAQGNPCPGVTVVFTVVSGGGSVTGGTVVTDDAGMAAVGGWTLGTRPGSNTLRARGNGMPPGQRATFRATAVAGPGVRYSVTTSSQDPLAGTGVTIRAALTDSYGNAVATPGVTVTWSSTGVGGSFSSPASATNSSGVATVTFTTGAVRGVTYSVTATDASGRTGTSPAITTR
jgi:adhesin/invasin